MGAGMQRRKQNGSRYDSKQRAMLWTLQLHFEAAQCTHTLKQISDTLSFAQVRTLSDAHATSSKIGHAHRSGGRHADLC